VKLRLTKWSLIFLDSLVELLKFLKINKSHFVNHYLCNYAQLFNTENKIMLNKKMFMTSYFLLW